MQPGNAYALAQAMREALHMRKNARDKLAKRARARMLSEFDIRSGLMRTLELYNDLSYTKRVSG